MGALARPAMSCNMVAENLRCHPERSRAMRKAMARRSRRTPTTA